MKYTTNKIEDQKLAFAITTEHNEKEITFIVVCANDESEIPDLVAYHLAYLDAPPTVYPQQEQPPVSNLQEVVTEQQAIIANLIARIETIEKKEL
jgi:hypothetical protein